MIRFATIAAVALIGASVAAHAQAGWIKGITLNGLLSGNGIGLTVAGSRSGVAMTGLTTQDGAGMNSAAAAMAALLQGLTLPKGFGLPR